MTREEWIAYHVARAPKITVREWEETVLLLAGRSQEDGGEQETDASPS